MFITIFLIAMLAISRALPEDASEVIIGVSFLALIASWVLRILIS